MNEALDATYEGSSRGAPIAPTRRPTGKCGLAGLALLLAAGHFATAAPAAANPAKTRAYIDRAWATLTRSMSDCSALTDAKVVTRPVLYLPAQFHAPASLAQVAQRCHVDVRVLPRVIHRLGDLDPTRLPAQGLLYLPHPYVVPGGFFNEMYGWDSYFIVLGLIADHRGALALDMVENALFEVEHYGGVLNANRTYYLSRSQPPFLSAMIAAVLDDPSVLHGAGERRVWLASAYPLAVRNYEIWTRPANLAGKTGLARYYDLGRGPVLEMRNSDYYRGVIKWLLAHRTEDPGYLIKAPQHPDAAEAARLARESCDVRTSPVCAGDWFDGYRLTAAYYRGDRAMRESGFDINFHFGPFGGSTQQYAPVCLNSLLYRYAVDLRNFAKELGRSADAAHWAAAAAARKAAIDRYLWQPASGIYRDFDYRTGKAASSAYLTTFYPLWAGVASARQAASVRARLSTFERRGGLMMDDRQSGAQWDAPYGWAPIELIAIEGLRRYGYSAEANGVSLQFLSMVLDNFRRDGTIHEKYNVDTRSSETNIQVGYKTNVVGFGWTNGAFLALYNALPKAAQAQLAKE